MPSFDADAFHASMPLAAALSAISFERLRRSRFSIRYASP